VTATDGRPVRAALFDLDGTLVDSLPTIAQAMAEAARMHGLHAEPDAIVPHIGAPMDVLVQELFGVSSEVARAVNADYLRVYEHGFIQRTPPHEGAAALLRQVHDAGVLMGVVTNKRDRGARLMVEAQGWDDLFAVVHGRESGAPKPDPEAALSALRRLDVPPEDAAFVGDTEFDMNCARDAGIPVVVALLGSRSRERLITEGATHVVDHLNQVAPILVGSRRPTETAL